MDIQSCDRITSSTLQSNPGVVLYRPEIELLRSKPSAGEIIAGACVPDGSGSDRQDLLTIRFHGGLGVWQLSREFSIQKATSFESDSLPRLIEKFEVLLGVMLPAIKVLDMGVGVYSAQSQYAEENPWAMQDGQYYRVMNKEGRNRAFKAHVKDGRTLIAFVGRAADVPSETFDPRLSLTKEEWKSLQAIPEPAAAPVAKVRAGMRP